MTDDISLAKLEESVHDALKGWHQPSPPVSPLDHLQLFQQSLLTGDGNIRQATNKILLEALGALAEDYQIEAALIRRRYLDRLMMGAVANGLNISEATAYRRQQVAIRQLALILQEWEAQTRENYQADLEKRLRLPAQVPLFGVEESLEQLQEVLISADMPWIVALEGLGGIGKTALANDLVRQREITRRFYDIGWISAKRQEFLAAMNLQPQSGPALTDETLIDALLEQLGQPQMLTQPPAQKKLTLTRLLKQRPYLVVIDNLETVTDYKVLLPLLRQMANPSKFLLTSRHSLRSQPNVFCYTVKALALEETLHFTRYEAKARGLAVVANTSEANLERIYQVVGGHPLALKLVVGQLAALPLSQVLDRLKQAQSKNVKELYNFIYWQAWHLLKPSAQQVLLVLPLVADGSLSQLLTISQLTLDDLNQALEQLINLSLVQVGGELDDRRYSIHRLTETFLLREALKWQSSGSDFEDDSDEE